MINRYALSLAILFAFIATASLAQIPNASFESWTGGNPDGWSTLNNGTITYVTQTSNAHAGTSAAKSSAQSPGGATYLVSFLYTGTQSDPYFACNCRPEALHFWYILQPAGSESLSATVGAKQNGTVVGAGNQSFGTPTSVYQEGIVNITYGAVGNMDSMSVSFIMGNPATNGTYFIVDDLSWGAAGTGVAELHGSVAALESVSPNPASNNTEIVYHISEPSSVQLAVYDMLGRCVKTIVNEKQGPGRYKAVEDFSGMASGLYTCKLVANGRVFAKTFVITQ